MSVRSSVTKFVGALVAMFAFGGCFTPWAKPASYSDRDAKWRPDPPGGTYAPAYAAPSVSASSSDAAQGPIDAAEAVRIALAQNPTLRAAFDRVEAAKARVASARSAYFPTIDGVARYDRTYEAPSLGGFTFGLEDAIHSIQLRGSWMLFDGLAREYRVKAAKLGVEEDRAREADARRLLKRAVEAAYYDAVGADERLKIAEADLAYERELLSDATKRNAVGAASLSDKLNFEVRVEAAVARVAAQRSETQTLRFALAELLGLRDGVLPPGASLAPLDETADWVLATPDVERLVADALGRRPDLAATAVAEARADAQVGVADGDWWPSVNVVGEAGRRRLGDARYSSDDTATSLALEARWNLFRGGQTAAARREALANRRAARAERARLRNKIIAEIRRGAEVVRNAQAQLKSAERRLALTRQARDLVRTEYDAGNATLVRLNEAQRDYTVAQANRTAQRVALRVAWSALNAAAGE